MDPINKLNYETMTREWFCNGGLEPLLDILARARRSAAEESLSMMFESVAGTGGYENTPITNEPMKWVLWTYWMEDQIDKARTSVQSESYDRPGFEANRLAGDWNSNIAGYEFLRVWNDWTTDFYKRQLTNVKLARTQSPEGCDILPSWIAWADTQADREKRVEDHDIRNNRRRK